MRMRSTSVLRSRTSSGPSTRSGASSQIPFRDIMQLSPVLTELAQYPFTRLDDWKAEARAEGVDLIDFGMGDPREVTPAFIREALAASIDPVSSYPRSTGLPELREAIGGWIEPPL